jgi:hypothetical protein
MGRGYKVIAVKTSTYEEICKLKKRLGLETYDDVIRELVNAFNEYQSLVGKIHVHRIMCNDFREARAVPAGWVKLVMSKVSDVGMVELAFKYLVPDPEDPTYLIVDKSKCVEGVG